jgi:hypothetical protein
VQSPAARFFGDPWFEFGGGSIPLTGHRATLEGYERKREGHRVRHRATVSVDPPGIIEFAERWTHEPAHKVIRARRNDEVGDSEPLSFVNAEGRVQVSWVWEGSLLEELLRLSKKLAKRYLWESAQATMFVLTGEIPARPPLRVSYEWKGAGVGSKALKASQGVVTLEVVSGGPKPYPEPRQSPYQREEFEALPLRDGTLGTHRPTRRRWASAPTRGRGDDRRRIDSARRLREEAEGPQVGTGVERATVGPGQPVDLRREYGKILARLPPDKGPACLLGAPAALNLKRAQAALNFGGSGSAGATELPHDPQHQPPLPIW